MIRSSLHELITERRFGSLRIGQELSEVRSAFADVPNLDSFWTGVRIVTTSLASLTLEGSTSMQNQMGTVSSGYPRSS